ncbi:GMC family oxidoreductase [Aspergillus affinis]|uniref:GMC family oxidoreductase n=1 Tax=Aspergillus affinis TaxID=1070780 RepID=UPI0022FF365B|nr:alcohol oxidase [Aspergillus affinis]KAI9036822.1 alcohol oxidase [Aspergillus affinis]
MTAKTRYTSENLPEFLSTNFDYVVVGGGTTGLLVAARLTENPNVQVGVLEAGGSKANDPNVDRPERSANTLHNPEYDWIFHSTPQTGNNDRVHHVPRGRMLGGSSGINFMAYIRPAAEDIDLWGKMGNEGWSWNDLMPYYLKSERLHGTDEKEICPERSVGKDPVGSHGNSGPIITSLPPGKPPIEDGMIAAFDETSGSSRAEDPYGGKPLGLYDHVSTVDPEDGTRSYAASAFLRPHEARKNLKVLTEATACKIIHNQAIGTATGIEFLYQGALHRVFPSKEIILAAGSIQTPQILEISGIGDPKILQAAGIPCTKELPDVGNNLCEHPMTSLTYAVNEEPSIHSGVSMIAFLPYRSLVSHDELEEVVAQVEQVASLSEVERHAIVSRLRDPMSGAVQFNGIAAYLDVERGYANRRNLFPDTSGHEHTYYTFLVTIASTLSRGSTHITSSDPHATPDIDLGLLNEEADVSLLAAGLEFADRVFSSGHVSERVAKRAVPTVNVDLCDRDDGREFARDWTTSFNHILGTCAMGRVVDERLRVKEMSGLRIVDASVIPTQISGNVMATVYAVAERAADLIKEDFEIGDSA